MAQNRTKEQIAQELKIKQETLRLRKFSSDVFYPFLKKNSESISDARQFLQIADSVIKGTFNEGLSKLTVGSLNLEDKVSKTAPEKEIKRYREIFEMFKDEKITSFIRIVSDLQNSIGGLVQEWESKGSLEDLSSPFPVEK